MKKLYFQFVLLVFTISTVFAQKYVTTTGAGTKDGSSWANASSDLQATINTASIGDVIWVAAGTYTPTVKIADFLFDGITPTTARDKTFKLMPGVKIFGGFVGNELPSFNLNTRDFVANETILSGDLGVDGKAYHVVSIFKMTTDVAATELNGFTIKDGLANDAGEITPPFTYQNSVTGYTRIRQNTGAGVYVAFEGGSANLSLKNLNIKNNEATDYAGGLFIYSRNSTLASQIDLSNCTFINNSGTRGGAIYHQGAAPSQINIDNTSIGNNPSPSAAFYHYNGVATINQSVLENNNGGGAIFNYVGILNVDKSIFRNNIKDSGGAISLSSSSGTVYARMTLTNSVFYNNEATSTGTTNTGGAAILVNTNARATVINSTFYKNKSTNAHGAISFNNASNSHLTLYNDIFNGNFRTTDNSSADIRNGSAATIDFKKNLFQINAIVPLDNFVDDSPTNLFVTTTDTDPNFLRILEGSATEKGDNALATAAGIMVGTDLAGSPRLTHTNIDLGAYEYQGTLPVTITSFNASLVNGRTQLKWSVGAEVNVKGYQIERSHNGVDFQRITQTSSNHSSSYTAVDASPLIGVNYYRLKTLDQNGTYSYFGEIRDVKVLGLKGNLIRVYPNPVKGNEVSLSLSGFENGVFDYKLVSVSGANVQNGQLTFSGSLAKITLSASVSSGMYVLYLTNGTEIIVAKLMRQ